MVAVSAAVNGGNLLKPYIVSAIKEPFSKSNIYENKTINKSKVISDKTSALVRHSLESVVANGSGRNAYIENYRVGGKTGTAQKVNNGVYMDGNYILSFIGFLPADKPEIVVYVAVDNPKNVIQYGGTVSAPIARNIMLSAINVFDIKKRNGGMLKEYMWMDKRVVVVPSVIGLDKNEAKEKLSGFNVKFSGSGNKIIYQSPKGGLMQSESTTVYLLIGD